MTLTREEHHALTGLAEQLITATDDHLCRPGPVRQTAIEIRDHLYHRSDENVPVPAAEPVTANWQCPASGCRFAAIHPMTHPCPL